MKHQTNKTKQKELRMIESSGETDSTGNQSNSFTQQQPVMLESGDSQIEDSAHGESSMSVQGGGVDDDGIERTAISCLRFFVLFLMIGATIGAGVGTWNLISSEEHKDFVNEFDVIAEDIKQLSYSRLTERVDDFTALASTLTGLAINSNTTWPFFTDSNYPMIVSNFMTATGATMALLAPLVQGELKKEQWALYSQQNQGWISAGLEYAQQASAQNVSDIFPTIFQRSNGANVPAQGEGPFLPLWQSFPATVDDGRLVNFDLLSDNHYNQVFNSVVETKGSAMTDFLDITNKDLVELYGNNTDYLVTTEPYSLFLTPVFKDSTNEQVVAILNSDVSWLPIFARASDEDVPPVDVVIDEGCQRKITIRVTAQNTAFLGFDDFHDSKFDQYEVAFPFAPKVPTHHLAGTDCSYTVRVFPTEEFWHGFHTSNPGSTAGVIAAAFVFIGLIFFLYDAAVHVRQKRILLVAAQSEKILSVLYPKTIRDRLFGLEKKEEETATTTKRKQMREDLIKATRYQLKHFMKSSSSPTTSVDAMEEFGSKPIADLFLNATVLFADIAGFTAWSSVREPAQVFTLLETVYRAFDVIAKRRKVFKVETVGDCYVAVSGLPEPTKAHATIMAGFARDCVARFVDLVSLLETTLGPDTGDLGIRVGMHSGPVTAGVLRGDKSRFQLFGDTVNTCARIESTGQRNRIQLSEETADLLAAAGKVHWLRSRDEPVTAKGKGKLHTYWLLTKDEERAELEAAADRAENDDRAVIKEQITQAPLDIKTCTLEEVEALLSPKVQRLCRWNVDVLAGLLRRIVAHRNSSDVVHGTSEEDLADREAEIRDQYMVLDEVVEIIPLPGFDPRIYRKQQDPESVHLPDAVIEQMRLYVACVAVLYRDNAFHNFEHASHVMMSVSKLLSRIVAADDVLNADENAAMSRNFQWSIHDHTYGITSDPMTQFSVILAALVHDLDHLGVSNFQLIKENHKLARVFKNKSVAEQNSIVLAWDILMDERFHEFRRTIYTAPFELERFRQLMANTVLATDIFDQQLNALRRKRWDLAFHGSLNSEETKDNVNRKATIVIEHLIQASDVSHTMQHWHIYCKWNERLFREMTAAYSAGRMTKNPADTWYEGEIGFFDNYVIPLAKKLKECGVFGVSSDEYLNYAIENRREWAEKGEAFVADLARRQGLKRRNSAFGMMKSPKRQGRRMSLSVGYMTKVESVEST